MNTKQSQITITKHNDSLLIDISINTQIVLPKALTIAIFFNVIKDLVFLLGREIILEIILKLDAMIYEELKENLKRVGAEFRLACYCDRTLVTPFGKIFFRYRYVQLNGKHFSPLLWSLGIQGKTRVFIESCIDALKACLFTSFRKAAELGGGDFCAMTLWRRLQEWGEEVRRKEKEAFEFVNEGEKEPGKSSYDIAYVMIDGIWEQMQTAIRTMIPGRKRSPDILR